MATIKSYTDISQSKKLSDILPIESADYTWKMNGIPSTTLLYPEELQYSFMDIPFRLYSGIGCPCWSLAVLLGIIPKHIKNYNVLRIDISDNDFAIWYDDISNGCVNETLPDITMESAVDACVEMIIKLKEQNLI